MKDITDAEFVAATPIQATKRGLKFGESTIVPREKNLIVLKKNK
jgi:hypothetical protein